MSNNAPVGPPAIPPAKNAPVIPPAKSAPVIPPALIQPAKNTPVIPPAKNAPVIPPAKNAPVIPPALIQPAKNTPVIPPAKNAPVILPAKNAPVILPAKNAPVIPSVILPAKNIPVIPLAVGPPVTPQVVAPAPTAPIKTGLDLSKVASSTTTAANIELSKVTSSTTTVANIEPPVTLKTVSGPSTTVPGPAKRLPGAGKHLTKKERKAARKEARNKKLKRTYWQRLLNKIGTIIFISALVMALFFFLNVKRQFFFEAHPLGYGEPATENSFRATTNFYYSCYIICAVSVVGFFIIHLDITSIFVGILYLFMLTLCIYFSASSLFHAYYAISTDTFQDIFHYLRITYNRTSRIPGLIDSYQRKQSCCGWSERFTLVWSDTYLDTKTFATSSIPDSCCVHISKGCGSAIIRDRPSGFIAPILEITRGLPEYCDAQLQRRNISIPRNYFLRGTASDRYLRAIDLQYYLNSSFEKPVPCLLSKRPQILAYYSWGAEELQRLSGVIFTKSCDFLIVSAKDQKAMPNTSREDQYKKYPNYRKVNNAATELLKIPTIILSGQCFIMAIVFMYYFSKTSHEETKKLALPREFTDYNIEGGGKEDDDDDDDEDVGDEEALTALSLELARLKTEQKRTDKHERDHKAKIARLKVKHEEDKARAAEKHDKHKHGDKHGHSKDDEDKKKVTFDREVKKKDKDKDKSKKDDKSDKKSKRKK